ncbi:hypothetical protein SLEP1_g25478 [Rubroshorea leprosula]|uniref:Uncharacterized protein n=1 Tax=Rubroshorea leprosula TaxID=152421 RepID=A0AAV5JWH4_9ROSI|nr:hypothetical protein SLEP1_g25478 [Rubroshorea leprosula]
MRLRSWLSGSCSTTNHDSTVPFSMKHLETTSSTDISTTTASSSASSIATSLQSSVSLLSLPSLPSLQNLPPETLDLSVSHLCVASLNPRAKLPITCLAVHGYFLYAASANEVRVYERKTWTLLDTFNSEDSSSGSVKAVSFCEGKVFTAHQDCKIRVWQMMETQRHKLLATLPTVNDRLRSFLLPKNYVSVRRHVKRLWIEHADAVTGQAVNNGLIYSVSWDKSLKVWRGSDLRCLESVKAHEDAINTVAVSADGTVYTGSADNRIRVWAKPLGEKRHALIATLEKHKSAVNTLALSDDGSVLFSGSCDRSILVWEREDRANHMAVTGALRGHKNAILCLINVTDLLFSGSADRTVRVWLRGQEGRYCCLSVLEGHQKPVKSLAAVAEDEPNGVVSVVSGGLDGELRVWRVLKWRPNCTSPDNLKMEIVK